MYLLYHAQSAGISSAEMASDNVSISSGVPRPATIVSSRIPAFNSGAVCRNVRTEPPLIPLMGEQLRYRSANTEDGARLDISAENFWGDAGRAFFDVRVFNPLAPSLCGVTLKNCYQRNERDKIRQYEQRVFVRLNMVILHPWFS